MAKKVTAKVKPSVLAWARESAGLSLSEAAKRADIAVDALQAWETPSDPQASPSVPKLRKLAEAYKRPLAVLYLPEPPLTFQALKDFRRLPGGGIPAMPAEVVLEARLARERRESVLSLAEDAELAMKAFSLSGTLQDSPEELGGRIRDWLGISAPLPSAYKDATGHKALKYWRAAIESKDVLVLQSSRFPASVASGFAIYESTLPIIVISRKEATPRRRLFSLVHEFAHLVLRASGVSDLDLDVDLARPPEELRVEVFCNAVAAAALMPTQAIAQHRVVRATVHGMEWTDQQLDELSRDIGASREAILRRLLTMGLTTKTYYEEVRDRYRREWDEQRKKAKAGPKSDIPRNMAQEAFGDLGRRYVGLVLDQFYHQRLTLSDVAGHFGVKTRHIPAIEQMVRKSA